jgi:parvulin-like peptidyl-prolyl isomerase
MLKSVLREPLVHFLLLGAALFAADAWLRPASAPAGSTEIVVGEARIRSLAQNFRRTWQRPPSAAELEGLVASHVREEILYREALALGLDRDDAVIRRRLQQKVEFVSEEAAALAKPSEQDLAKYLADHADAFRIPPRVTFRQIFLDPRQRGGALDADARRLLDVLNGARAPSDPSALGDGLALLEPRYEDAPQADVARQFGQEFAAGLVKQPQGRWSGPVASGYGAHLVRVDALAPGRLPTVDEVRPLLEREWSNARRQEVSKAFYDKLRAKYKVTVQMPEPGRP